MPALHPYKAVRGRFAPARKAEQQTLRTLRGNFQLWTRRSVPHRWADIYYVFIMLVNV
jgi:hypothetical protein